MKAELFYHKCGYPVLCVKKDVFPATDNYFLDGNNPIIQDKDGSRKPVVIERCPQCNCVIRMERLLSSKPETKEEDKAPNGYMPARI